ncbi:MAG: type II toxin-antitoxin system RelE/ParE family toxin [Desulfobulbaceae bacterium]|nr:type II toxin-antitoxin system RelE/ParE family toxin [Desulfobulbaceae bacterium]
MNSITWSKKAQKQLFKISRKEAIVIYDKVENLKLFPDCQNIKQMKKHKYGYRLRVGNYRVLFDHDSTIKIVSIEEVKKSDERTY